LVRQVIDEARDMGSQSMAVTFDHHPRKVLHTDYVPQPLSTLDSKLLMLSKTGVDSTTVLHFDSETASMTARDFMKDILRDRLNVRKLVIGYDHRFGRDRAEGFDDYVRYGRDIGMDVVRANVFMLHGYKVSSSVIRRFLQDGEIEMANMCLGHPYTIEGNIIRGYRKGREMGFPTANIDPESVGQMIPETGVYAVRVRIENSMSTLPGMMNIGHRPTFGGHAMSLETNIFNFSDDIYGKRMLVSFMHRIRGERLFDSQEELAEQLRKDRDIAERQFEKRQEE